MDIDFGGLRRSYNFLSQLWQIKQLFFFFFFTQDEIDAAVRLLLSLKLSYKTTTGQDYQAGLPPKDHALINNGTTKEEDEDLVDPWNVQTSNAKGVDYDKLIGTTLC